MATDLIDKIGWEYPFRTEDEAKVSFIRDIIQSKEKNWAYLRKDILGKFEIGELKLYNKSLEIVNYLEKELGYIIKVDHDGFYVLG